MGIASDMSHGHISLDTHSRIEDTPHYQATHSTQVGKGCFIGISQLEACAHAPPYFPPVLQIFTILRMQTDGWEQEQQRQGRKKPSLFSRPRHTSRLAIIHMK